MLEIYAVLVDSGKPINDVVFVIARNHDEAFDVALLDLNIPYSAVRAATITPQSEGVSNVN